MLDISKVLNRSWHILWKYRILWIFGMFLAMAGGGSSGPNFNWTQNMNDDVGKGPWSSGGFPDAFGMSAGRHSVLGGRNRIPEICLRSCRHPGCE
jgi:hypothetical protein